MSTRNKKNLICQNEYQKPNRAKENNGSKLKANTNYPWNRRHPKHIVSPLASEVCTEEGVETIN